MRAQARFRAGRNSLPVVALALAVMLTQGVSAASSASSVTVIVRDAVTNAGLNAVVTLVGAVRVGTVAGEDGRATIDALPGGDYELTVARRDYATLRKSVHVEPDANVVVNVRLTRAGLRTIGTVSVRSTSRARVPEDQTTPEDRALNATFGAALSALPGVTFRRDDQPGAPLAISLEGHDPTQTAVTLDGIPLNVPGLAANLASLDLDLVQNGAVTFGTSSYGAAGSVALQTLRPTSSWQEQLESSYGTFSRWFTGVSASGTAGALGVAVQHVQRAQTSPLDGQTFADTSGTTYDHHGANDTSGDSVELALTSGHDIVSLRALSSNSHADALCTVWSGALPCGYGPGNVIDGRFSLTSLTDVLAAGPVTLAASAYRVASSTDVDLADQLVAGLPLPYDGLSSFTTTGAMLDLSGRAAASALDLQIAVSHLAMRGAFAAPGEAEAATSDLASRVLTAADHIDVRPGVHLTATVNEAALGTVAALNGSVAFDAQTASAQAYMLSASTGRIVDAPVLDVGVPPASTLEIDCAGRTAFGTGAGTAPAATTFDAVRASWSPHMAIGTLTVQGFGERETDAPFSALVDATSIGSALPPEYLADAFAEGVATCGPGTAVTPYLTYRFPDVDLRFVGLHVVAARPLARSLTLQTTVDVDRVTASSVDPLLQLPTTVFRPGAPIPGAPIASALVDLAYRPPGRAAPSLFAGVRYTGAGNQAYLPPYATVALAVEQPLREGTLSLLVENLFDAHAGVFVAPAGAVSLLQRDAIPVGVLAFPQQSRAVTLAYTVAVGRNARAEDRNAARAGAPRDADDVLVPGTRIVRWPMTQPQDPFRRNTGTACSSASARVADDLLGVLQSYVRGLDRVAGEGALPATPHVEGAMLSAERTRSSYAVTLETQWYSVVQALLQCATVHVGSAEDARAAGIPAPSTYSFTTLYFYYTPSKGIYFVQLTPPSDVIQKFRTYALPEQPPAQPFAVQSDQLCLPDLRETARSLLGALAAYFARPNPPSGSAGTWAIVRHGETPVPWYELRSDDLGALTALVNCGRVGAATREALRARGVGGAAAPTFNYAPALGLYVVVKG